MNTIPKIIFTFVFTFIFINFSFTQWIQTNVPSDFLVFDMEVYKDELYAVVGYKVIKFQEDGLSFDILTDNYEFQNALASNDDYIFASTNRLNFSTRHGILRSVKGDTTWTRFENQLPNTTIFSLSAKDSLIAVGGTFGVYASWDNGEHWKRTLQYPGFGYFNTPILLTDSVILVGGEGLVNVSFDTMRTWTTSEVTGQVREILEKGTIFYAVTGTMAYKSIDQGLSWQPLNNGLLESSPITTIIDYTEDSIMIAAGGKIFTLKHGEDTWHLYDSPDFKVENLIVFEEAIWVGGRTGIWKRAINNLVSSNEEEIKGLSQFQLSPNPFQDYLTIKYENNTSEMMLLFYDVNGQLIEGLNLGNSAKQFSMTHLANGLYFYQVINGAGQMIANGKVVKH